MACHAKLDGCMHLLKIKESPPKLIQKVTAWTGIPISYCILVKLFTWTSLISIGTIPLFFVFYCSYYLGLSFLDPFFFLGKSVSLTSEMAIGHQNDGSRKAYEFVIVQNLVGRKRSSTTSSSDPFG